MLGFDIQHYFGGNRVTIFVKIGLQKGYTTARMRPDYPTMTIKSPFTFAPSHKRIIPLQARKPGFFKRVTLLIITIILCTFLAACTTGPLNQAVKPATASTAGEQAAQEIVIFYTNDEHGWMLGVEPGRGAAEISGLWDEENIEPGDIVLVLSGGDNWTGPAISTWMDGQSMVEVMNAMDYDASTIGNHEFDFGLDVLKTRLAEASFPFLSANIRHKSSDQVPTDLGIEPYTILDENGLQIGIIGLTTTLTPGITKASDTGSFDFIDYESALREYIPEMREAGADLIFVASHICTGELFSLARSVADLEINFMGGGHCHEKLAGKVGDTVIVSGGSNYQSYAYTRFTFDFQQEKITRYEYRVEDNRGGKPDPAVAEVIARWEQKTDDELNTVIGYLENEIPRGSQAMEDLVTQSWLSGYASADIAITNKGGFRDKIPAGSITLSNIISVLPFDNVLYDVTLTGEQIRQVLIRYSSAVIGGIHKEGFQWVLDQTGDPLQPGEEYSVLVIDYLYFGGDGFDSLAEFDPDAYNTSIDWRQPVIDWILAQNSSPENPLDQFLQ
jgi:5'-nucleotidase / UDP-sugar diphosphatase